MKKIGLDFGTTNSIICYESQGEIKPWQHGGAGGEFYVPSMLSMHKEETSLIEIGRSARANLGDSDYSIYLGFKMLLGEDNPARLTSRGYKKMAPHQAARTFLRKLTESYKTEQGIDDLESVVLTVPEIWVREGRHLAREELKALCDAIDLPVTQLLSEPVAAAVYFSHAYREREGSDFSGHVLVCDYGGGTLDLSLSAIQGNDITVLESAGFGYATQTLGRAGLAFDEAVLERLYQNNNRDILKERKWFKLLKEFEEQKIHKQHLITKFLPLYLKNSKADKKLFQVDDMDVKSSDLFDVFDRLIKPDLLRSLDEMFGHLKAHEINFSDGKSFRVLMVGGFSSFHLVQDAIRNFFDVQSTADSRFSHAMTLTDTALAIAKGAALVAQEQVKVHPSCPINLGVRAINKSGDYKDLVALKRGTKISSKVLPYFADASFFIKNEATLTQLPLEIWMEAAGKYRMFKLKGSLQDYVPPVKDNTRWSIGFSVDRSVLFSLHVRDQDGVEQVSRLGKLSGNVQTEEVLP